MLSILLPTLLAGAWQKALAHDLFRAYIQHRVAITIGSKHVDVTVQLTFFEEGSEHERQQIDANGDGWLSRSEVDGYLNGLEARLSKAVTLEIAGSPVTLMPLRAPDLDLLGQDHVGPAHHRLTLYYFASTPAKLPTGAGIIVEDRLWPEVRALGSIRVEGKDGCRLEALPDGDPVYPAAKDNEARCFKARVLSPPVSPSAKASRDGRQSRQVQENVYPRP